MAGEVEIAQKVVAERGPVVAGGAASDAIVGKAIDAIKVANQESALNIAANRESSPTILEGLRDQNIGYTNEKGKRVEDQGRKDRAKERQQLYDDFSKKNLTDLTQHQQDLLIEDAAKAIKNLPGMASHFASLPPGTDIDAVAKQIARTRLESDPSFKKAIIDLFLERNDPGKPLEDKVTSAVGKEEELRIKKKSLEDRRDELKEEIDAKEKRLTEHQLETGKGSKKTPGLVEKQKSDLSKEIVTLQAENDSLDVDITQLDSELQGLTNELRFSQAVASGNAKLPAGQAAPRAAADIQAEITTKKGELQKNKTQKAKNSGEIEAKKKKVDALDAELPKLEESLTSLRKELQKIETELTTVTSEYKTQQAEVKKLKALKVLAEEAWVQSLEGITREATITHINSELKNGLTEIKTLKEKEANEEKDTVRRGLLEPNEYIDREGKPRKDRIERGRRILMQDAQSFVIRVDHQDASKTETIFLNGAEQALADRMGIVVNPTTEAQAKNNARIVKLLKDDAFRSEMSGKVAKDILTYHLWSGGRLTKSEIIRIHTSAWGKGMVAQALEGRADLKAQVDAVVGKGVLNWSENLAEQLKKIDWKKFLMILLIIAGVVGGVGLLVGMKK